ncbi:hypothetical protein AM587_10001855 [Phytophthora nicotianae]|uniref:Uncharacterized protein n=1 Tax=Phytophthora nicotianae TaxID=4792 RepID=A0A0W8DDP9_PHYNI|nr:hypothetical protein AM587_10001855 [Phytophthora nicotianae]
MPSSAELLTDAAFFLEASDFLDMNATDAEENGSLAIPELRGAASPTYVRGGDISGEAAINALKLYREKEKLRRRKQRQRIKDEIEGLRRMSDELSLQLKNLKLGREVKRFASNGQFSIWKEVALAQREERLRSEAEQRKLTTTANTHAAYIDHLRGLFHLRPKPANLKNDMEHPEISNPMDTRSGMSGQHIITLLLQKIDVCYARIDDVMSDCGLATMVTEEENSTHWRDDSGELEYHQKLQKHVLPFDMEKALRVVWKSYEFPQHQHDRQVYDGFGHPENTFAMRYRLIRTLRTGTSVSVIQRFAVRRFFEKDRVICVWKVYTEGEGVFRGIYSNLTGWGRMRSLSDNSGILCEVCIRQFPVVGNVTSSVGNEFHQFLHLTLDEDKHSVMTTIQDRPNVVQRGPSTVH